MEARFEVVDEFKKELYSQLVRALCRITLLLHDVIIFFFFQDSLNAEYEERFGFRFVVFVNRRPKSEILDVLRERADDGTCPSAPPERNPERHRTSPGSSPAQWGQPAEPPRFLQT